MLRDNPWLSSEQREAIDEALTPPPTWRDPVTGAPAGFGDEDEEWAEFERSMRS